MTVFRWKGPVGFGGGVGAAETVNVVVRQRERRVVRRFILMACLLAVWLSGRYQVCSIILLYYLSTVVVAVVNDDDFEKLKLFGWNCLLFIWDY